MADLIKEENPTDLIKQKKSEAVVLQNALRKNRNNIMKFIKEVEAEEEKEEKDEKLIKEKVEEVQKLVLAENMMLDQLKPLMAEIKNLEGNDMFNKLISNADARAANLNKIGGRRRKHRKKRTKKRRKSRRRKRRRKKRTKRRR